MRTKYRYRSVTRDALGVREIEGVFVELQRCGAMGHKTTSWCGRSAEEQEREEDM